MEQPISRQTHGVIDYAYGALVAALPEAAGFSNEKNATTLCRVLAGGALTYSLLTDAEWGVAKVIPFKKHLLIDLSTNVLALGMPWLLGFAGNTKARNSILALALSGIAVSLLTKPENR